MRFLITSHVSTLKNFTLTIARYTFYSPFHLDSTTTPALNSSVLQGPPIQYQYLQYQMLPVHAQQPVPQPLHVQVKQPVPQPLHVHPQQPVPQPLPVQAQPQFVTVRNPVTPLASTDYPAPTDFHTQEIDETQYGLLVGIGGEVIDSLRDRSKATIIIIEKRNNPPRKYYEVIISGNAQQVELAKMLVLSAIDPNHSNGKDKD